MNQISTNVAMNKQLRGKELIQNIQNMLNETDKEKRDRIFEDIWFSVKAYTISVLNSTFPTYYQNHSEGMLQEAALEIFLELKNYNPEKGAVITFLRPIIIHSGQNYVNTKVHGTTAHYGANINKINKCISKLRSQGIEPTPYLIAENTKIPISTIHECLAQMNFANVVHYESKDFLSDLLESNESEKYENMPEESFIHNEEVNAIQKYLKQLPTQTREVILYKYGFKTGKPEPDSKIADIMGINKSQVRRLLTSGQRTLTSGLEREQLFASRSIRREIDETNKKISFVSKTTEEDLLDAQLIMESIETGF